uniref:Ig-like domain-containing protein n=1 Tax=Electrophorus electricus TaxID=8005 RepID=A0AAY5F1X1_ELEEL
MCLSYLYRSTQGQDLVPPGPIYRAVGEKVLFITITSPQLSHIVTWNFMNKNIVTFNPPATEMVDPEYIGRVSLNKTSGALELSNLIMADSGVYTVTFTSTDKLVSDVALIGPEYILIEHNSAQFTCVGNGTVITTEWMKDNQILAPSTRFIFSADNRTLLINPIRRSDSGEYQCTLSNPVSSNTSNYRMTINYGPNVWIMGTKVVEKDSDVLLLCSSASRPAATVTWTVNGMSAGHSPLYVAESSNLSHSGEYICTAWNNVTGLTASAVHFLTVKASELSPGAAAGIAAGVIVGVEVLIVILYSLITHFK